MLADPPTVVRLAFSEGLDAGKSSFRLIGPDGDVGTGLAARDGATTMTLEGLALAAGDYRIKWTAAAEDGHVERGSLAFTVSPATPEPVTPSPVPTAEPTTESATPTTTSSVAAPATSVPTLSPATDSPTASPEPTGGVAVAAPATDVLVPILAGLLLVALVGGFVLRRSRRI